jgi:HlyD family secretion protein
MKSLNKRQRIIILVVLLAVVGLGAWYYITQVQAANNASLQASGTVEAVDVAIAAELSGRVAEVMADKGQTVTAGQPIFRLDDQILEAQREQAVAAVDAAKANQQTADDGLASAQAAMKSAQVTLDTAKATAQAQRLPVQKSLDDLTVNSAAARGEAARSIALANRAVRDAEYQLYNYTVSSLQKDLTLTEGLSVTKKLLDKARATFEPYRNESENNKTRQDIKEILDDAQSEYDSAVRRIELEAALETAQTRLHKAEDDLSRVQNGPDPQDVAILTAQLAAIDSVPLQAEAALEAARVGVDSARSRLEAAKAAVTQAQSALGLIDVQISKLTIISPLDGVVLNRNVEPGEVVAAGSPVLTVGKLSPLKITVYLPEDRLGKVSLGQMANVTVDSFPGKIFPARITYIADKAEFTPRNVQTTEGRRNTVFAIELSIDNPDDQLKPGMPADVSFQ